MMTDALEFRKRLQEIQNSSEPITFTTLPSDEPRFLIDINTRTINIPVEFSFLAVKNDHMAETIYFEIDRYFDDADLSEYTCVVQFLNRDSDTLLYNEGISSITSMDITTIDGKIIFGWKISNESTQYAGNLYFAVRFYSINEDNEFTYNLNTVSAESIVLNTLNVTNSSSVEIEPSELQLWMNKMNQISVKAESALEAVNELHTSTAYYAEESKLYAEQAKQCASQSGYMSFTIENGRLIETVTENVEVNFSMIEWRLFLL